MCNQSSSSTTSSTRFPSAFAIKVDVRRFGVGERVVPLPYTRAMFEKTQAWMQARNLFDAAPDTGVSYEQAVDS